VEEADLGEVRSIEHPWGTEEVFADIAGKLVGKILHVREGAQLSLQSQVDGEEVISLMSGAVLLEIGADPSSLKPIRMVPGQTVHIQAGTAHRISATEDSMLLEVLSGNHRARDA